MPSPHAAGGSRMAVASLGANRVHQTQVAQIWSEQLIARPRTIVVALSLLPEDLALFLVMLAAALVPMDLREMPMWPTGR